jgi:pimeloyl-ACP methyl ester carboxylesterase
MTGGGPLRRRACDPAGLRGPLNWYRALPFSLREPAGPIQVPTMFAWGNRDRFVSRAAAELCGRYVTGPYRLTELDGRGIHPARLRPTGENKHWSSSCSLPSS